tara:strand:- start:398 stop:1513 length:1116 start_codon:yes stop_codon:yes gene_type:complete
MISETSPSNLNHFKLSMKFLATILLSASLLATSHAKAQLQAIAVATTNYKPSIMQFQNQLDLTKEQKEAWQPLRPEQGKVTRTIYLDKELAPEKKREKYQSIRKEQEDKLENSLTEKQKEKLTKLRAEFAERMAEARKPWQERVGLDEEQKEKVKVINDKRAKSYTNLSKKYQAKLEAIYTDEQKAMREELTKNRGQAVRRGFFNQIKLSEEQLKKWREIQAKRSEAYRKANEKYRKNVKRLLTQEQLEKYEILWQRPGSFAQIGAGSFSGGRVFSLGGFPFAKQLDLTEDQRKKLEKARQDYSEFSASIYLNKEISAEEKRGKMRKAVSDYQSAQNGIRTEEQKKKLKELRSSPGNGLGMRVQPIKKKKE